MKVVTERIERNTKGGGDLLEITEDLRRILVRSGLQEGSMTVFVVGSTAGITAFEYEPGLIKDVGDFFDRLIPSGNHYHHDDTWGDANGYSHVRATITGQSYTIPFEQGRLLLGSWQQVVLAEFDNRPRNREIIVQLIGE